MKVIVKATAPTHYQYTSLSRFGMDVKKHGDGSFSAQMEFDSKKQAKEYLLKRAEWYCDAHGDDGDGNTLQDMRRDIRQAGSLQLDAIRAYITTPSENF